MEELTSKFAVLANKPSAREQFNERKGKGKIGPKR